MADDVVNPFAMLVQQATVEPAPLNLSSEGPKLRWSGYYTKIVERIATYYEENPGARLTTVEASKEFGYSETAMRQAFYMCRQAGVRVQCERVYVLKGIDK